MLVLSRKPGEKIYVGSGITITVLALQGNRVRIGIAASPEVPIMRAELVNDFREPTAADARQLVIEPA